MGWSYLGRIDALANARAAVMVDGRIFAAGDDGRLWRLAAGGDGQAEPLGESGWETRVLAAVGGTLFAFEENGHLYAVDPEDGAHRRLDNDWSSVRAACGAGDELIAAAGHLFVVEPSGGGWHQLGDAEYDPRVLLGDGESVYSVENDGSLYRVQRSDGAWEQLEGRWGDVCAGAARRGGLFLASEAGHLYLVGPTGAWAPVAEGAPPRTRFLFLTGRRLWAVEPSGDLSVLELA